MKRNAVNGPRVPWTVALVLMLLGAAGGGAAQQAPSATQATQTLAPRLTLQDAEQLALKNHPQVLAAQHEAAASGQVVKEIRSAYYPTLAGALTGSQGN